MNNEDNKAKTQSAEGFALTGLRLGNFKAFADSQSLPIKPLTLIFGANSAGKSSLIHSLLLANHALANGNVDVHQPKLAGQSVDLGGFHEFVYRHEFERGCTFEFSFSHPPYSIADWFGSFSLSTLQFEISKATYTKSKRDHSGPVGVSSYGIKLDDHDFLQATRGKDGSLRIANVNFDHPYFKPFFAKIDRIRPPDSDFRKPLSPWEPSDVGLQLKEAADRPQVDDALPAAWEVIQKQAQELSQSWHAEEAKIRADFFDQLRLKLAKHLRKVPLRPGNLTLVSSRARGPRDEYIKEAEVGAVWRSLEKLGNTDFFEEAARILCFEIEDLLDWINEEFNRSLDSFTYLGPLRCYPPRYLVGMHDQNPNWFSGGGHAWDILRHDAAITERINSWLGSLDGPSSRYEIKVRRLQDLGHLDNVAKKRLADRLMQVGPLNEAGALAAVEALLDDLASDHNGTALGEIVLLDKRNGLEVSHRDVGVGISQVLPVVVHAYADQHQIVAIEQPEIHLHPALQAELGDVFIQSALGGRKNTFLLETHSEHLILRILRRVRETTEGKLEAGAIPVRPEDVSVVFVETTANGSVLRHLPVTPDGDFSVPWPGGFFAERFQDLP